MKGLERRQTSRMTMEKHAYINIEPNNGGIVLNVSDGGLCFHSFDPVQRNGKIRFWFWDHNQRIEADGTLAWTDETQKGGLRFAALPAEAREKIRDWMSQPAALAGDEGPAPASQQPRAFPTLSGARPDTKVPPPAFVPLAVVSPELRIPIPLSGFSRGLVTGLLVSAVVLAAVLFHSYRREFGESLIQLGERFAAKPQAQVQAVSAGTPAVLPAPQVAPPVPPPVTPAPRIVPPVTATALPVPTASPVPAPIRVPPPEKILSQPEKLVPQPLAIPAKLQQAKLESATLATTTPTAAGDPAPKAPAAAAAAPAISSAPPTVSVSPPPATTAVAPASNLIPDKAGTAPKLPPANQPGVQTEDSKAENADSTRELYFEVGKFKNVLQAHDQTDKLAELGFPATAVEKGHLWTNSFHVLVGPYPDEDQAKTTHENLLSSGFKPRPFEKGWRSFTLLSPLTLNGARTPVGEYVISWESYIGDASVKFMRNNFVVATAGGRWVKRDAKYPCDAYVYRRNPDGSRTLLEIHFGGMRQALVFGKAS
jgi:hypothetical protein